MTRALVFGASGFIGSHLVRLLKSEGYWVRAVDIRPAPPDCPADEHVVGDLRDAAFTGRVIEPGIDELYQLAADMGGAGYIFTGEHDAAVMHNSSLINLHAVEQARLQRVGRLFYSSSACIYPRHNQTDPAAPECREDTAYPADPDSEYGWEKLFSERLYQAFGRNHGLDVRIARLHNVYGPGNPWRGGKEKAPGALCRKVAETEDGGVVEIWGDGQQTRSFLFIDDCLAGIRALMRSPCATPVNLGSEDLISLDDFARLIARVAGKTVSLRHLPGPVGVRGRRSDNRYVFAATGWRPHISLTEGITQTYRWVAAQAAAPVAAVERLGDRA